MKSLLSIIALFVILLFNLTNNSFAQQQKLKFVKFTHRQPVVGLVTQRQINLDVAMTTSVKQTVLSYLKLKQYQSCEITLLEIANNNIKKVKIAYSKSKRSQTKDSETDSLTDPVVGKTYFATITDEKLILTDVNGKIPSAKEIAIITTNLDSIRKPNPLAQTLSGKTFFIGQTIPFSKALTKDLFGGKKTIGNLKELKLKFDSVKVVNGKKCAVLTATIDGGGETKMSLKGTFLVEIDTCRTVSTDFSGPIEIQRKNGSFLLQNKGTVKISMSAKYSKTR